MLFLHLNNYMNIFFVFPQKVDLFSLGIILFEMSYRPFATGAERISVLSQLRMVQLKKQFKLYALI